MRLIGIKTKNIIRKRGGSKKNKNREKKNDRVEWMRIVEDEHECLP